MAGETVEGGRIRIDDAEHDLPILMCAKRRRARLGREKREDERRRRAGDDQAESPRSNPPRSRASTSLPVAVDDELRRNPLLSMPTQTHRKIDRTAPVR